jgi:hypothetical protein
MWAGGRSYDRGATTIHIKIFGFHVGIVQQFDLLAQASHPNAILK